MLITRFNEFKDFEDRFLQKYKSNKNDRGNGGFSPNVNIREGEYAYHIDVDLPGVEKEDIKIDVKNGQLFISGERNSKKEVKEEDYHMVETRFGRFSRSFSLPDNVDIENTDASCNSGVLEVVIPKLKDISNQKTIPIK